MENASELSKVAQSTARTDCAASVGIISSLLRVTATEPGILAAIRIMELAALSVMIHLSLLRDPAPFLTVPSLMSTDVLSVKRDSIWLMVSAFPKYTVVNITEEDNVWPVSLGTTAQRVDVCAKDALNSMIAGLVRPVPSLFL